MIVETKDQRKKMDDQPNRVPQQMSEEVKQQGWSVIGLINQALQFVNSTKTYQQLTIRLTMLTFISFLAYIFFVDNLLPTRVIGVLDDLIPGNVKPLDPEIFEQKKTEIQAVLPGVDADLIIITGHIDDRTDVAYFASNLEEARKFGINIGSPILIGYTQAFVMRFLQEGLCTSVKTTLDPSLNPESKLTSSVTCPIISEDKLIGSVTAYYRRSIDIEKEQYNLKQITRFIMKINQGKL